MRNNQDLGSSSSNFTQGANLQLLQHIEKLRGSEYTNEIDTLKKLSVLKHKEILRETLAEFNRRGCFVCIYPAKGSEIYDKYFASLRPLNKFVQRMLFTEEMLLSVRVPLMR